MEKTSGDFLLYWSSRMRRAGDAVAAALYPRFWPAKQKLGVVGGFEQCDGRSRRAGRPAALGNAADGFMDSNTWAVVG